MNVLKKYVVKGIYCEVVKKKKKLFNLMSQKIHLYIHCKICTTFQYLLYEFIEKISIVN